jgi:hypothetical protein
MALVFDSLGYTRELTDGGLPQEQVEAMAAAAREHIMLELVSKQDLLQETHALRADIARLEQRLEETRGGWSAGSSARSVASSTGWTKRVARLTSAWTRRAADWISAWTRRAVA